MISDTWLLVALICLSLLDPNQGDKSNSNHAESQTTTTKPSSEKCPGQDLLAKNINCKLAEKLYDAIFNHLDCNNVADQQAIDLAEARGCKMERYIVNTTDGYKLTVHHLICRNLCLYPYKGPVIFVHGFVSNSRTWLMNFVNESLAFLLAAECYDVYLLNTRGSSYSLGHETLSCKDPSYWNYSFHESGTYDIPETIDFVLAKTGCSQVVIVAHSMGGASTLIMLSLIKKYNALVSLAVLMSPVMSMNNSAYTLVKAGQPVKSIIGCIYGPVVTKNNNDSDTDFLDHILQPLKDLGNEIPFLNNLAQYTDQQKYKDESCRYYNSSRINVYNNGTLLLSSLKCIAHFLQMKASQGFYYYDYYQDNPDHYNQTCAPAYPLENITTALMVLRAQNDGLVNASDILEVSKRFKNLTCSVQLIDAQHSDYCITFNGTAAAFPAVISEINKYASNQCPGKPKSPTDFTKQSTNTMNQIIKKCSTSQFQLQGSCCKTSNWVQEESKYCNNTVFKP